MAYSNNHYIPQFILRRFGNKLNRYNVQTGEIKCKGSILNAFSGKNIYPEWLEHMFCDLESKMAVLIDTKILNVKDKVTITRADNWLIKKFFAVAMLRVPESSSRKNKYSEDEGRLKLAGFKEVSKDNESPEDYSFRTLKVILESKNLEDLYNHPEVTYEACKWASLFSYCYISIWDSSEAKEDFVITDNGMNCEHDKTRFKTFVFDGHQFENNHDEMLKSGYVIKKLNDCEKGSLKQMTYLEILNRMRFVHANYYLFAVSNTRTISLINPFYRLFDDPSCLAFTKEVPDVWPTLLSRETMKCNTQTYKNLGKNDDFDLFHYDIKSLSIEEVIIVNAMMLDRVYLWMGFDNSAKIAKSLNVYSMIPKEFQRKNYDKLIEYVYSLGYDFPKIKKYENIRDKLTINYFSETEMEYIKYCYNLIKSF